MHAFGDHVVGQHQVADDGDVVIETARRGIGRNQPEPVDEGEFVHKTAD